MKALEASLTSAASAAALEYKTELSRVSAAAEMGALDRAAVKEAELSFALDKVKRELAHLKESSSAADTAHRKRNSLLQEAHAKQMKATIEENANKMRKTIVKLQKSTQEKVALAANVERLAAEVRLAAEADSDARAEKLVLKNQLERALESREVLQAEHERLREMLQVGTASAMLVTAAHEAEKEVEKAKVAALRKKLARTRSEAKNVAALYSSASESLTQLRRRVAQKDEAIAALTEREQTLMETIITVTREQKVAEAESAALIAMHVEAKTSHLATVASHLKMIAKLKIRHKKMTRAEKRTKAEMRKLVETTRKAAASREVAEVVVANEPAHNESTLRVRLQHYFDECLKKPKSEARLDALSAKFSENENALWSALKRKYGSVPYFDYASNAPPAPAPVTPARARSRTRPRTREVRSLVRARSCQKSRTSTASSRTSTSAKKGKKSSRAVAKDEASAGGVKKSGGRVCSKNASAVLSRMEKTGESLAKKRIVIKKKLAALETMSTPLRARLSHYFDSVIKKPKTDARLNALSLAYEGNEEKLFAGLERKFGVPVPAAPAQKKTAEKKKKKKKIQQQQKKTVEVTDAAAHLKSKVAILKEISKGGMFAVWALRDASAALRSDRGVVLAAVRQRGYALIYASAALQADRDVVLLAVAQDGDVLQYACVELQADRAMRRAAGL